MKFHEHFCMLQDSNFATETNLSLNYATENLISVYCSYVAGCKP